jgi:hypothetical protein
MTEIDTVMFLYMWERKFVMKVYETEWGNHSEPITVTVVHIKQKGCGCGDWGM